MGRWRKKERKKRKKERATRGRNRHIKTRG